ncbi:MAG: hypothetical protein KDD13_00435 [Mangrovimonas sp.]|nr:hypothetical protein [Mangrovimonas sp.]
MSKIKITKTHVDGDCTEVITETVDYDPENIHHVTAKFEKKMSEMEERYKENIRFLEERYEKRLYDIEKRKPRFGWKK